MTETMEPPPDPQERHDRGEPEAAALRAAGLNRGQIWVSEDFDAPLPDEFRLGQGSAPLNTPL